MLAEVELDRDLGLRDRILALRSLESFTELGIASLGRMAEFAQFRRFKAGEVLLREGALPDRFYIVLDGQIRVERQGKLVALVQRSRGVGILSTLARDEVGVTATAEVDSSTLEIPTSAILAAYEEDFALVRNSLRLSASHIIKIRRNLPVDPEDPPEVELGEYTIRPRTTVERIIDLRKGPLFSTCNIDAVIELARRGREVRLPAGTKIWDIGAPSDFTVRIDYGRVRCESADGEHAEVGAGYSLGVMDSLAHEPRKFSATAVTDLIMFRMDREIFLSVIETHHKLAMELVAVMARPLLEGN